MKTKSVKLKTLLLWIIQAYLIVFFCTACGGGSDSAVTPPLITTQPVSLSVYTGRAAIFSVVASGAAPLSYQWKRDGVDIPGATTANYVFAKAQLLDSGSIWTVVVSNKAGSVTSAAATLKVSTPIPGISLFAGRLPGLDGQGAAASFSDPSGITVDLAGNIYVADFANHTIRKITPSGFVTTLAGTAANSGSADGQGPAASFFYPDGICVDVNGNLYVIDSHLNTIRKITPSGFVTTIRRRDGVGEAADGSVSDARFHYSTEIAVDASGNLYLGDETTIRKISPSGYVSVLAGAPDVTGSADGQGAAARFKEPRGIALDSNGNIYVADTGNRSIRKISPTGYVTTLAGNADIIGASDGIGASASFSYPIGIAVDVSGNIFVSDQGAIRKINNSGVVSTLAGTSGVFGSKDGLGAAASFSRLGKVALDASGNLYVSDSNNNTIRKISTSGFVTTLAGSVKIDDDVDGEGGAAQFLGLEHLAIDSSDNLYTVSAPYGKPSSLRRISSTGVVTTLIKDFGDKFGAGIVLDPLHNIYINYTGGYCGHFCVLPWGVMKIDSSGAMTFPFSYMKYLAADRMGNSYVADGTVIKKFSPDGSVIVLAGTSGVTGWADGPGNMASFYKISKGALDAFGNLYVVDGGDNIIRKISASGVVTTLAGGVVVGSVVDGFGTSAGFKFIKGIAVDASGNIYVTDIDTIRKITPAGLVTTIVGKLGTSINILGSLPGGLSDPRGLAIDSYGVIFVCSGGVILKIQL